MRYKNNQPFVQMYGWNHNDTLGENQDVFDEAGLLSGLALEKRDKMTHLLNGLCLKIYQGQDKFTDQMCDLAVQIASFVYSEKFGFDDKLDSDEIYNAIFKTTFGDIANFIDSFSSVEDYTQAVEYPKGDRPYQSSVQQMFETFFYQVDSNGYEDVTIAEYTDALVYNMGVAQKDIHTEFSLLFGYYIAKKIGLKKVERKEE